jgi:hypothetical protein
VIDEIIGQRKARAFLFPSSARDDRIEQLFDARVLHVLKKNISSRGEPGVRYDVYKIDFAEHVARHPEDVGRTVEDFNWILRRIVRPAA